MMMTMMMSTASPPRWKTTRVCVCDARRRATGRGELLLLRIPRPRGNRPRRIRHRRRRCSFTQIKDKAPKMNAREDKSDDVLVLNKINPKLHAARELSLLV